MHEAHCGSHACQPEEIGDGCCEDEGEGPVDGHDGGPEQLAFAGYERGRVEPFHEEVIVDYFYADVAVESGGD